MTLDVVPPWPRWAKTARSPRVRVQHQGQQLCTRTAAVAVAAAEHSDVWNACKRSLVLCQHTRWLSALRRTCWRCLQQWLLVTHAWVLVCVVYYVQVVFRDPVRYKLQKVLTVAAEGTYSGQVCRQTGCGFQQQGARQAGSSRQQQLQLDAATTATQAAAAAWECHAGQAVHCSSSEMPMVVSSRFGIGMPHVATRCCLQHSSRGALQTWGRERGGGNYSISSCQGMPAVRKLA
jgi:hypothetical protein